MALKLAIEDVIGVNVEGKTQNQDGSDRPFKFVLNCERYSAEQMRAVVGSKDETAVTFFEKVARDWSGQRLVLDDEGKPAAFSAPALALLMTIPGMSVLCWQAYLAQVQATAKN